MDLDRNVGGIDRIGRTVLAALFAVLTLGAFRRGRRGLAALTLLASAGLAFNAVTCFCGLNAALGLDTTDEE
ncbi:YgaP-like transmembrane domain [Halomarina rubra]|uniref:YgaP-like transmembrane domain n=1 Tax=Halomarina rubra TaxID=2071873 RepID=A0ABD6AVK2_9EURY|nr:YgaP-like transmembrane domain [Halomarina rubra]